MKETLITAVALTGILAYVVLRFVFGLPVSQANFALYIVFAAGAPLLKDLLLRLLRENLVPTFWQGSPLLCQCCCRNIWPARS